MEISGPLSINVIDNETGTRELHLSFKPDFRILTPPQQAKAFQHFINQLNEEIHTLDKTDPNYQGILTILQVCEQLNPHIDANELPLEETIIVTLQTQNLFGNIQIIN